MEYPNDIWLNVYQRICFYLIFGLGFVVGILFTTIFLLVWWYDEWMDWNNIIYIAFLFIVPTIAHIAFSWIGFNPTDDGFTLAYSRRLLDGQIPHKDFIIIRPILSPLLHTPIVYLFLDLYRFLFAPHGYRGEHQAIPMAIHHNGEDQLFQ